MRSKILKVPDLSFHKMPKYAHLVLQHWEMQIQSPKNTSELVLE